MKILHCDSNIAVCIKPVGADSEHQMPLLIKEAVDGEVYTLHRLDKNVGGVMVYARTKAAAGELSRLIQNGGMVKEYIAQVHGTPPESGDWEDLLFKDSGKNKVFVVNRERKNVKKARLEYTRISSDGVSPALVRVRLHTGRSHQIRVQFASRGYPLLGDRKYGGKDEFASPRLYSCRISFELFGERMAFEHFPDWAE